MLGWGACTPGLPGVLSPRRPPEATAQRTGVCSPDSELGWGCSTLGGLHLKGPSPFRSLSQPSSENTSFLPAKSNFIKEPLWKEDLITDLLLNLNI